MRKWMSSIALSMLACVFAAQCPAAGVDATKSRQQQCAAYLGTLTDKAAVLQIPLFFGSYEAVRENRVPARRPADDAASSCYADVSVLQLPDLILSDSASLRVVAAGRSRDYPWIAFVYPAQRGSRIGYRTEVVLYRPDGLPLRQVTAAYDFVDGRYRDYMTGQFDDNGLFYCAGTNYAAEGGKDTDPGVESDDPRIRGTLCDMTMGGEIFPPSAS